MGKYILIDIGGTAIKYALSEEDRILFRNIIKTESGRGKGWIQKRVMGLTEELLSCGEEVSGIAISSAGIVDIRRGRIVCAGPTIPDYSGTEFKQPMEERFGIPCEIENDVNCAALAEYRSGAAKGSSSALCLTIGTGIGGAAILDGKILRGFTGSACEVGYMHMRGSSFEELGAASILSKRISERKGGSAADWDGKRIFREAKKGDRDCILALDELCAALGEGISNIVYILNPEVVVLGGGIMAEKDYLYPRIRRELDKNLIPMLSENTKLRMAKHKNEAGMLGAYYHFCAVRGGGQ